MKAKRKDNDMLVQHKVKNPYGYAVPDLREVRGELRYDPPEQEVTRTLRDDPLARLHDRGQISEGDYEAGRIIQRYFEDAEFGRIGSSGNIKEPVDGGNRIPEVLTERQRRAIKRLNQVAPVLGQDGFVIIRLFLAERQFAHQIALKMGYKGTQRDVDYISRRVRECLTAAAKHLCLA